MKKWKPTYAQARNAQLKHAFGITLAQYNALMTLQGGVCAICRNPEHVKGAHGAIKSLAVDHCHLTGEVRGLLCSDCNRAVGYLHDEAHRADNLAAYLRGGFRFRVGERN